MQTATFLNLAALARGVKRDRLGEAGTSGGARLREAGRRDANRPRQRSGQWLAAWTIVQAKTRQERVSTTRAGGLFLAENAVKRKKGSTPHVLRGYGAEVAAKTRRACLLVAVPECCLTGESRDGPGAGRGKSGAGTGG